MYIVLWQKIDMADFFVEFEPVVLYKKGMTDL